MINLHVIIYYFPFPLFLLAYFDTLLNYFQL